MNRERLRVARLPRDIADWLERTPADKAAERLLHIADAITALDKWWVDRTKSS